MNDYSTEVPLQPSVEELIKNICSEKCLLPPDVSSRRSLSTITEESALKILNAIASSKRKIRNFSGFIVYLVKEANSSASISPDSISMLPQKRYLPPSSVAESPQNNAYHLSPNLKQFVISPCSSSKQNIITEYFPKSGNNGSGSSIKKQIVSFPPSGLKDTNTNTTTLHFAESSIDSHRGSSVQRQLIFSPCSGLKNANPRNISQPFPFPQKANDHVCPLQQPRSSAVCSLCDATPSKLRQQFVDLPNASHHSSVEKQHSLSHGYSSMVAPHNGIPIPEQHILSRCENFGGPTPGNILPEFGSTASNHSGCTSSLVSSQQSLVLSELEFRRLFMVHGYVGRKKLEDVVSIEDAIEIKSMKNIPMFDFEARIWAKYGRKFCQPSDRAMHLDWDSRKTYLYRCYLSADGSYQFKGPFLNTRRTHLQRELGDENVLIVQFVDDPDTSDIPYCNWVAAYQRISGGISIGLRHYRLFAFKDGRDKGIKVCNSKKPRSSWPVKCYFVRQASHAPWDEREPYILFNKTSHEARCLFMHVHMVSSMSKYISRCSFALSNTIKLRVDLDSVHVERIEDIFCQDENGYVVCNEDGEPLIHTDGTGFISEDLAILCAKDFFEANETQDDSNEFADLVKLQEESPGRKTMDACIREPPLLVQCRVFKEGYAVKGTLLVNKKLKARTIQIRPSMIKVEKDSRLSNSKSFSSLEICSVSRRPRKANLSRNLIALLTVGGVPKEYFMGLLEGALQDAQKVSSSMRAAVRVGLNYAQMDDSATSAAMIGSGIPLDEPYLQYRLSILANEERKGLRLGKIPLNESFYLIGTADPTGILNSDEVCVILENGQISGRVLVYRNPGVHFGDIRVLNARYVAELEEFVGNAKYGIFFSTKGRRSVGTELANGDFDGDLYWVSRSPQLLQYFKVSDPWVKVHSTPSAPMKKPGELSCEELENEIFALLFATQKQNMVAGTAGDSWLAHVDRYLVLGEDDADAKCQIKEKLLKLVDLLYDAVDAPKSGKTVEIPKSLLPEKYPHFLEKRTDKTYHSSSVLGLLYDTTKNHQPENALIQDIWKLPSFNVEIPEESINLWKDRYRSYRQEMSDALRSGDESKNDSANLVIKKYKQMLYEAEDFATSTRKIDDIYNEALAIYHASYDHAKCFGAVSKCGFAWKVAGEALCSFHHMKTPGRSIPFKLPVLSTFI